MLNTKVVNNVQFNSVAGTLVKSCTDSRMVRFHMNSEIAKHVFSAVRPNIDSKEIEVLQVMLCGGDNLLVEYRYVERTLR